MSPLRPGGPGLERRSASLIGHMAKRRTETAGERAQQCVLTDVSANAP